MTEDLLDAQERLDQAVISLLDCDLSVEDVHELVWETARNHLDGSDSTGCPKHGQEPRA